MQNTDEFIPIDEYQTQPVSKKEDKRAITSKENQRKAIEARKKRAEERRQILNTYNKFFENEDSDDEQLSYNVDHTRSHFDSSESKPTQAPTTTPTKKATSTANIGIMSKKEIELLNKKLDTLLLQTARRPRANKIILEKEKAPVIQPMQYIPVAQPQYAQQYVQPKANEQKEVSRRNVRNVIDF